MNNVKLCGNISTDITLGVAKNNASFVKFCIAVPRSNLDVNGVRQADFVPCTMFGTGAEAIAKHYKKASAILLQMLFCVIGSAQIYLSYSVRISAFII